MRETIAEFDFPRSANVTEVGHSGMQETAQFKFSFFVWGGKMGQMLPDSFEFPKADVNFKNHVGLVAFWQFCQKKSGHTKINAEFHDDLKTIAKPERERYGRAKEQIKYVICKYIYPQNPPSIALLSVLLQSSYPAVFRTDFSNCKCIMKLGTKYKYFAFSKLGGAAITLRWSILCSNFESKHKHFHHFLCFKK